MKIIRYITTCYWLYFGSQPDKVRKWVRNQTKLGNTALGKPKLSSAVVVKIGKFSIRQCSIKIILTVDFVNENGTCDYDA